MTAIHRWCDLLLPSSGSGAVIKRVAHWANPLGWEIFLPVLKQTILDQKVSLEVEKTNFKSREWPFSQLGLCKFGQLKMNFPFETVNALCQCSQTKAAKHLLHWSKVGWLFVCLFFGKMQTNFFKWQSMSFTQGHKQIPHAGHSTPTVEHTTLQWREIRPV